MVLATRSELFWAFQKRLSCGDLLAFLISSWLLLLDQGHKVAIYLCNISGAFEKIDCQRLLAKLQASGLNHDLVSFLKYFLAEHESCVIVEGEKSKHFFLKE